MQFDFLALAFRWMHILAAATMIGGVVFMRLALLPSLETLAGDARGSLHEAIRGRWVKITMAAITFLLVSGVYNIVLNIRSVPPTYHMLLTLKLLLALGIFFVASALTGRSEAFAKLRENRKFWLSVNLGMALVVILVSGAMRRIPRDTKAKDKENSSAASSRFDPGATG